MRVFQSGIALAVTALLAGCGSGSGTPGVPATSPNSAKENTSSVTFVVSGDTAGFIVPCGCTTKQFGGLPRRATYLTALGKSADGRVVYVDAGGSVQRGTKYDAIKMEYIAQGMKRMDVAALNIGFGEMQLGAKTLGEVATRAPLFSTNVAAAGHIQAWPNHLELEMQRASDGGRPVRLAFVGVCMNAKSSEQFSVTLPHSALRNQIPELAKSFDAVILLAYGKEAEVMKLASDFPELAAVFISSCDQSIAPRNENGLVVAGAAQKGKFLARAELSGRRGNWKLAGGEIVELSESFADDPKQLDNLAAYKQRLKTEKLDPQQTGETPPLLSNLPADYRYAGSTTCATCHVQDAALHQRSQHAHGLETLRNKDFAFDPFCLKCHTTGYGGPGGFVNAEATPELGGIGCENCHGPSAAHAAKPRVKTTWSESKSACLSCHDPENSPKFEFNAYWAKITHGQEKVK